MKHPIIAHVNMLHIIIIVFLFTKRVIYHASWARWSSGRASDFRLKEPGFRTTCGRASDFSVEGTEFQNHLMPVQNLGNFVHPTLPVSFGRETKSRWSLLPGVYTRGSKRSHTGGKYVTCRGLKEWWSLSLTHQFPAREGAEKDLERS